LRVDSDENFEKRLKNRLRKEREKIQPINLDELGIFYKDDSDDGISPSSVNLVFSYVIFSERRSKQKSTGAADISPMEVDLKCVVVPVACEPFSNVLRIDWDAVGGLKGHVQSLKEMVTLPLLYPELFESHSIAPPRGVLFYGPPGNRKNFSRSSARCHLLPAWKKGSLFFVERKGYPNLCHQVSFFMRKGADCLSKWVGEAERQLRLLFDQAYQNQPAIIFFDEIDGLAPVRSSKQDQIHSSIVSTLLALMDGLDSR